MSDKIKLDDNSIIDPIEKLQQKDKKEEKEFLERIKKENRDG